MVTRVPPRSHGERRGFALVAVLLTLSALGLLVSGLIYISAEELSIARSSEELFRTRLAAESVIRSALASWRTDEHRDLPIGSVEEVTVGEPGAEAVVETTLAIERLDASRYLLRAMATSPSGVRSAAAAVVRTIDPLELWRALPAAVTTTGPVEIWSEDALVGFSPSSADTGGAVPCQAAIESMTAAFSDARRPPVHKLAEDAAEMLRLGPLDLAGLRALADRIESGAGALRSIPGDAACATGTYCAGQYPLIYAPDGLGIEGGTGRGILAVAGDLSLAGDAVFHGVVLVHGRLTLTGQARILGAVLVVGPSAAVSVTGAARVEYDPCAVAAALEGGRITNSAYHPGDRSWLPAF